MLHCLVHDWAVMEEQRREEETKQKIERQVGQLMEEFIRSATVALSEQMPNIQRSALKRSIDTQPPDDEVMYPHRLRGIELTEDFFFFFFGPEIKFQENEKYVPDVSIHISQAGRLVGKEYA